MSTESLVCLMKSDVDAGQYLTALIGQPWARDGLHCWALVRQVQRDLFDRDLPPVFDVAPDGRAAKARLFNGHPERKRWQAIERPVHGAVALMVRRGARIDFFEHAGVYFDLDGGGLLHVDDPHGVVFDDLFVFRSARRWMDPVFFVPRD